MKGQNKIKELYKVDPERTACEVHIYLSVL